MESTFSLPSQSISTFLSPQLERSATGTEQPSSHLSRQLSDEIKSSQDDMYHLSSSENNQEYLTVSHNHLAVETSQKISMTSAASSLPRIVLKFRSQRENETDYVASNVVDTKTLVATNDEESAKDEIKKSEKRKRTFPTFSASLGREKIEADLLAMSGSKRSKKSAEKKRTTNVQNSFQEDLSSFSTDNSSDSIGSRFNLRVETSENNSVSDNTRKIIWKIRTAESNDKKNGDIVTTNAADQTLVRTESEEPGKVEISNNKEKAPHAVDQTLIAAVPIQPESTQLGFGMVPSIKENREKKKRNTFSTFSVSLTRDKIEADLIAMGGSTRTRRIKRRPKNVQRQLDDLFPGLRLKNITPDDYRVRADKT